MVGQLTLLIVNIPVALVADCPSGLVTVIVRAPGVAPAATEMFIVRCVASVNVTLFTVRPPPLTVAASRFEKTGPGSKKPEPLDDVPVSVTVIFEVLVFTGEGDVLAAVDDVADLVDELGGHRAHDLPQVGEREPLGLLDGPVERLGDAFVQHDVLLRGCGLHHRGRTGLACFRGPGPARV